MGLLLWVAMDVQEIHFPPGVAAGLTNGDGDGDGDKVFDVENM